MKILFLRHGESIDDLTDQYGGWCDLALTPKGESQALETAEKIIGLEIKFNKIYTSNLIRAKQFAAILSSKLSIPFQEFVYLKEMNRNGILTGLNRTQAKKDYPELVEQFENGKAVPGAETYEELTNRALAGFETLLKNNNDNFIVLSHGTFLSCLLKEKYKIEIEKFGDGGFIILDNNEILHTDQIKFV
ncbi:histidine phosphatase family protein [Candidatus Dojkabacteria bacterium]|nr:histidine phosphatase family protein [Candidatus Dojkabacteria bacterium]